MKTKALTAVFVILWLASSWIRDLRAHKMLQVYVLDVGQGDAILIRTPNCKNILVDGSGGDYVLSKLGEVMPPWMRRIDLLVLTHPHADHVNGLNDVVERYKVESILWNPVCYWSPEFAYFVEEIRNMGKEGTQIVNAADIQEFNFGQVRFEILWPEKSSRSIDDNCSLLGVPVNESKYENVNNESVVLLVTYGDFEMLLTGDAEVEVEKELCESGMLIDVEVLKAGHHCSRTASSEGFLQRIAPEVAVCSCGEGNKFGHPHRETIDLFEEMGIRYLRTDKVGTVEVLSDGKGFEIGSI